MRAPQTRDEVEIPQGVEELNAIDVLEKLTDGAANLRVRVNRVDDPDAGVPSSIQDEIRDAVLKLFAHGNPQPVTADPGNELMLKMMRACLGEDVASEYAPLMREEMGFVPREARWSQPPSNQALVQHHVLIVGAGVCAIARTPFCGSAFDVSNTVT